MIIKNYNPYVYSKCKGKHLISTFRFLLQDKILNKIYLLISVQILVTSTIENMFEY